MAVPLLIYAVVLRVVAGQVLDEGTGADEGGHVDHRGKLKEVTFGPGGSMVTRSTLAVGPVMRREGHDMLDGTHHSALIEEHVQGPAIKSCRHATWRDGNNPKRMTRGTYCVDTTQTTADAQGNAITQAALDKCATWKEDKAVDKFQASSVDCSQDDPKFKSKDVVACRSSAFKDTENPKRTFSTSQTTSGYCVDKTARTADAFGDIITQEELNKCFTWNKAGAKAGSFVPDYIKDCMGVDQSTQVSCGGHKATKCRLCTVIDPKTGLETNDRGPDWCHGDCTYYDQECHVLTARNLHVKRDNRTKGATTSLGVPDLLNPNITDADRKLMAEAAKRSIQEADYESKQRKANQDKKDQDKNDKKDKFIFIAITSASSCLCCCALVSVIMACCFIKNDPKKATPDASTGFVDAVDDS